ncbi:MAG: hypothetical protein ACE5QV_06400, partial [Fidelibacterota bacterium]
WIADDSLILVLDTTASKQILYWWGEDPDGEVVGYKYQWNYMPEPVFTTGEWDTFFVRIRKDFDIFTFRVWAIDDDGAVDPTPAIASFPVYNSPPTVEFRLGSIPDVPGGNPDVITYTFPTRTFVWDALDPDGNETITKILWALDDTSNWNELPGNQSELTCTDLDTGYHTFYLKAVDIAGAHSSVISFPDTTDKDHPNFWYVKPVQGDILLVNDYAQDQNTLQVQKFYESILMDLVGADGYSIWQIGSDRTPVINPQNALPYSPIDIQANLSYFDKVIWFSHLGRPNISEAGLAITKFVALGGDIFISNGNEERPDTTWTFVNIDSVFRLNPGGRLLPGFDIYANLDPDSSVNASLKMEVELLIGNRVSALIPGFTDSVVFMMEDADTSSFNNVPYPGHPAVGVMHQIQGGGKAIYFSLPLHHLNARGNVRDVLEYILFTEFEE